MNFVSAILLNRFDGIRIIDRLANLYRYVLEFGMLLLTLEQLSFVFSDVRTIAHQIVGGLPAHFWNRALLFDHARNVDFPKFFEVW